MSLNGTLGLGIVFSARDLASGTMLRLGRNLNFLRRQAMGTSQATTAGFAVMGVGAAILSAGMAGLSVINRVATMTGEFDMAMAQAGARARSTAGDLALMRQAALDVAASGRSVFDPTQSAQGLELLAAAGLSARESISALTPALGLATAGNIGVESSSRALVSALRVFSLDAGQSEQVANQMLAISNSTLLEARDLEAAMGAVGRGAVQAGQNMREMLPAMGLVRNSGVSAEVSAHAVSSALIYMSTHARDRFNDLGVSLTDATGQFRPFLDIVMDANTALGGVTDQAERAEQVNRLFGRFGMTAFSAITAQLGAGIRATGGPLEGQILRGAAAIAELRRQMDAAGGTIDYFLDQTLNTLPGQLQVLKAVASSIAIELGTPLASALKPAIAALVNVLQKFRAAWTSLPESFRTGIVRAFLLASAFLTFLGSTTLVAGAVILLLPFLKTLAITMGVIAVLVVPLAAGIGAIATGIYLFGRALPSVFGGLGSMMNQWERFTLIFRGLGQAFSDGEFSGSVRKELNRAENAGIRRFILQVDAFVYRVESFLRGIGKGINEFLATSRPEIAALVTSLRALADSLGLTDGALKDINGNSSKAFGAAGMGLGRTIVNIFREMVDTLRKVVDFVRGFGEGIRDAGAILLENPLLRTIWGTIAGAVAWVASEVLGLNVAMMDAGDIGYAVGVGLVILFGTLAIIIGGLAILIGVVLVGALTMMALVFAVNAALMLIALLPILAIFLGISAAIHAAVTNWDRLMGRPTSRLASPEEVMRRQLQGGAAALMGGVVPALAAPSARRQAAPAASPNAIGGTFSGPGGNVQGADPDSLRAAVTAAVNARPPPAPIMLTAMLDGESVAAALKVRQQGEADREWRAPGSGGD